MAERRARQLTFRGMQRRMERSEKRSERMTLGRWAGVDSGQTDTLTNTVRGGTIFNLPAYSSKTTFYGWDAVVSVTVDPDTGTTAQRGQILGCHVREGQSVTDFFASTGYKPNVSSADWQTHARASKMIPMVLIGDDSSTRGSLVVPLRLLMPKTLVLKRNESYSVAYGFAGTVGVKIEIQVHGRYRFVQSGN